MIREFSKFSWKILQTHKLDKNLKKLKQTFAIFGKIKIYENRRNTYRKGADES